VGQVLLEQLLVSIFTYLRVVINIMMIGDVLRQGSGVKTRVDGA